MKLEEARQQIDVWIELLVGQELQYISGRGSILIKDSKWSTDGDLVVIRNNIPINITKKRIYDVVDHLIKGGHTHVDTTLRSGGNDRSIIETILANLPPVGFMLPKKGRNKTRNKVIQWLNREIHKLGEIKDVSGEDFEEYILTSFDLIRPKFLSKPFLLLAGISGTGKTRFVREQAKASGSFNQSYCLTSVRPDWHEPSDLLGYISRLNGQAEYVTTDVMQFIVKAWCAMLEAGLKIETLNVDKQGLRLVVTGERDMLKGVFPYWLCLDEMNLAPVEQYFADYLSILETREWCWTDDTFTYMCDPLLKHASIKQVKDNSQLRTSLGFPHDKYEKEWDLFCQHGLGIPLNLLVVGTVNMDETTHGFSRKVIDRALSFDFGEFFPNDYGQFFAPSNQDKILSYPLLSQARLEDLKDNVDLNGIRSIEFLTSLNAVLAHTPFMLAYRALNELLLAVISEKAQNELTLKAVWDDFLMCKVLPRIEGDQDKLGNNPSILEKLLLFLQNEFVEFWDKENGDSEARPDLFREKISDTDNVIRIACRSKAKLVWMQSRLSATGFTSFWP